MGDSSASEIQEAFKALICNATVDLISQLGKLVEKGELSPFDATDTMFRALDVLCVALALVSNSLNVSKEGVVAGLCVAMDRVDYAASNSSVMPPSMDVDVNVEDRKESLQIICRALGVAELKTEADV